MAIQKVGVVGCGLMGGGIAQACAQAGYETVVREINQELLDKGLKRIYGAWDMMAGKGKLTQGQVEGNRARLHGTLQKPPRLKVSILHQRMQGQNHRHAVPTKAHKENLESNELETLKNPLLLP